LLLSFFTRGQGDLSSGVSETKPAVCVGTYSGPSVAGHDVPARPARTASFPAPQHRQMDAVRSQPAGGRFLVRGRLPKISSRTPTSLEWPGGSAAVQRTEAASNRSSDPNWDDLVQGAGGDSPADTGQSATNRLGSFSGAAATGRGKRRRSARAPAADSAPT